MLTNRLASLTQRAAFGLIAVAALHSNATAQQLTGLWDGTIDIEKLKIAFAFEISGAGNDIKGSFFNGDEKVTSTSGRLSGKSLVLNFDHYATKLDATFEDGVLKGTYGSARRGFNQFEAVPHRDVPVASGKAPEIGGLWEIENESPKGEHAWRFIVHQTGARVSAAILRVDGDTGLLVGDWKEGKYILNHYDGARAFVLEVEPKDDGTLSLNIKGLHAPDKPLTAIRPAAARSKGLLEPADFTKFTTVRDPREPFRFSFPDLKGNIVSNTDPKFRDKVVLINITGSWCPNCHDEAPFLAEVYRRYHSLGLEIVALDFEEAEQLKDLTRLPAFIKNYGIDYTYLVAGSPNELAAKIPQAVNLNSWPTTFFLGRDGRVRAVHAGFAAPASGEFHAELRKEFTATVERLLAETTQASR
jgi:thiol-disulfide isomerase/thioredoxin